MDDKTLQTIFQMGILAPSGDNMQPWRFRRRGDAVDLLVEPAHREHFFETGYRTLYITAGAAIENMRVASQQLGYRLTPSYFPKEGDALWAATLKFEPCPPEDHPHWGALKRRVTNRKFYEAKKKIGAQIYQRIEEMAAPEKGRLIWIKRDDPKYLKLCQLIGMGDQIRFENERIHREFMETVRFKAKSTQKTRDGLDIRTLETGRIGSLLFQSISSWGILALLNSLGLSRSFNQYAKRQMLSSQTAGLIVAPTHSPHDYLVGGEIMERIWHEITLQGLSMQPMEGIPVFLINMILEGGSTFTPEQKKKLGQLKKDFLSLFNITEQNGLILLFRMGFAKPPSARSLRRPLESFFINKDNYVGSMD